jgi:hypothetical protein
MKQYLEIGRDVRIGYPIYAFDKLDGSNIRVEWTRKTKFEKFGSRRQLIDDSHFLGEAIELFRKRYERTLDDLFRKERYEKATCFLEYYGRNSFAGQHVEEEHTVVLFDIAPYKKGVLEPREFLGLTNTLEIVNDGWPKIPKLLYHGNANVPFIESVQNGTLSGMTFEGVVCKGSNDKKTKMPVMFKIKNKAWIEKLKNYCQGDDKKFKQLL